MFPITLFDYLTALRFSDAILSRRKQIRLWRSSPCDRKSLEAFFSPRSRRFTRDVFTFLRRTSSAEHEKITSVLRCFDLFRSCCPAHAPVVGTVHLLMPIKVLDKTLYTERFVIDVFNHRNRAHNFTVTMFI